MSEAESTLDFYCEGLEHLREQLGRVLGLQTVDALIQRASEEINVTFPETRLIRFEESEMDLEALRAALAGRSDVEIRRTFAALHEVITLILARLVGREAAMKLVPSQTTATPRKSA